jgi:hypothetical protein
VSIQVDSSNFTNLDRVYHRIKQAARKFGAVLANTGGRSALALPSIPKSNPATRSAATCSLSGRRYLIPRFDRASLSSEKVTMG